MHHFNLPVIKGTVPPNGLVIYFSCDNLYYQKYGIPLIKSIVYQIPWINVHCHLVLKDETCERLDFPRTTYTYEIITEDFLESIPFSFGQGVSKVKDFSPSSEIVYYSCARFMQLDKIFTKEHQILQIDCDTLLFDPFPKDKFVELTSKISAMRKPKTPEKLIASAISFGVGSDAHNFRTMFADELRKRFFKNAYWFVDQDVMQEVFAKIDFESIPIFWNTWSFKKKTAYFRTAKGVKKENMQTYIEQLNYWLNYNT